MAFSEIQAYAEVLNKNNKSLIYINKSTSINPAKYTHPVIRNEKVGCSIHLSGTKSIKETLLFER